MLRDMSLWRHFDGDDGAAAGGAPAGAPAAAGQPPVPPATPPIDAAEHARLQLDNARLQARVAFPLADVELLGQLTDPAQISAVAQRTHELAAAAQPPAPAAGAPVPPDNGATAAQGAEERRRRELQFAVRRRSRFGPATTITPAEADEARELFFATSWNAHMEHRRTGRGNVSEPPRGAPAGVAQPAVLPLPGRAF